MKDRVSPKVRNPLMGLAASVLVGFITFLGSLVSLALVTRLAARNLQEVAVWIWPVIGLSAAFGVFSFLLVWWQFNRAKS
jgi:hypothetical protein